MRVGVGRRVTDRDGVKVRDRVGVKGWGQGQDRVRVRRSPSWRRELGASTGSTCCAGRRAEQCRRLQRRAEVDGLQLRQRPGDDALVGLA